ncbi:hypothetical protein LMG26411_02515 [Cupriavidus numazuensis]|uniref:Uncharacterized protein n=1 Tax=Cupriavidus numazuensis TaxID=221992 RepID=A0ABM8TGE7_9BURK|nr:hypothetical protein LMG26411_02515 [Cupriavidus numazuensis]
MTDQTIELRLEGGVEGLTAFIEPKTIVPA